MSPHSGAALPVVVGVVLTVLLVNAALVAYASKLRTRRERASGAERTATGTGATDSSTVTAPTAAWRTTPSTGTAGCIGELPGHTPRRYPASPPFGRGSR